MSGRAEVESAVERNNDGVVIRVYAAPRATVTEVVGVHGNALKIALAAPPVEGAANRALVGFLAKRLGVPRSAVSIISGQSSRQKRVRVDDIGVARVVAALG